MTDDCRRLPVVRSGVPVVAADETPARFPENCPAPDRAAGTRRPPGTARTGTSFRASISARRNFCSERSVSVSTCARHARRVRRIGEMPAATPIVNVFVHGTRYHLFQETSGSHGVSVRPASFVPLCWPPRDESNVPPADVDTTDTTGDGAPCFRMRAGNVSG